MSDYLDVNNEELLKDFFTEAEQQVDNLESNILVIENDPSNHEAIDEIFRAAHTLKGGSATVEMMELSTFTHTVEDVLDELRSDRLKVTEDVVDVLLTSIDVIKAMLESRANGSPYQEDVEPILSKLRSFIPEKASKKSKSSAKVAPVAAPAVKPEPTPSAPSSAAPASTEKLSESEYAELMEACAEGEKLWCVTVQFDENNPMNSVGGIQVFAALKACGTVLKTIPDFDALYEDEFYPTVQYFLTSSATSEKIEDVGFLSDVTLSTDAQLVNYDDKPVSAPAPSLVQTPIVPEAPTAPKVPIAPETPTVSEAPVVKEQTASPAKQNNQGPHITQGSVLRVDSKRIDYLLNLVSETVITKAAFNQIATQMGDSQVQFQSLSTSYKERMHKLLEQIPLMLKSLQEGESLKNVKANIAKEYGDLASYFDEYESLLKGISMKFRSSTQNLGRIASELQEGVLKIRMVPISQIFSRFPRVVRDLQRDLHKSINLVIEGEDTELDKSVIEDLLDPIMHCVRNSVDHGIESPEVRKAAGKPEQGTLLLRAANEGNLIVIEVVDDGAGIDVNKVRNKAIERGLIHPDKIITDQDAYQLIFLPGFSTSDKISNVSGRGVGLDVVKTMIGKVNGTVSVSSEYGKGTKFTIRIPLTLAIIQGLLVRVGKEVYSIPVASVIESQRVKNEEISTIDNYEVLNVRNEVISVLRLSRLFNIKCTEKNEYSFIVIVGSQEKKIGVMVDALIGEEDVVIKPLRDQFTNSPGIAGASILGDGSVSLIIDVSQLLDLGVRQEISAQQVADSKL